uniref:Putative secreted protein n=1 Tax=Anopheles marajoara TaxID=58244 RepID=A0A2M4C7K2_9DIPT
MLSLALRCCLWLLRCCVASSSAYSTQSRLAPVAIGAQHHLLPPLRPPQHTSGRPRHMPSTSTVTYDRGSRIQSRSLLLGGVTQFTFCKKQHKTHTLFTRRLSNSTGPKKPPNPRTTLEND